MSNVLISHSGLGISVLLPSPDFGNTEELNFDRINRRTRGGDLIVYRDPEWTHTITLKLKFSYMTQLKVNAILSFYTATLGKAITLRDWENFSWTGVITSPPKISQPGPNNYVAEFQFTGAR